LRVWMRLVGRTAGLGIRRLRLRHRHHQRCNCGLREQDKCQQGIGVEGSE
jgi:hypothetical protein